MVDVTCERGLTEWNWILIKSCWNPHMLNRNSTQIMLLTHCYSTHTHTHTEDHSWHDGPQTWPACRDQAITMDLQFWTAPGTCSTAPHRQAVVTLIGCWAGTETFVFEDNKSWRTTTIRQTRTNAGHFKLIISNRVFTRRVIKSCECQPASSDM